jgi:hypothetical protein
MNSDKKFRLGRLGRRGSLLTAIGVCATAFGVAAAAGAVLSKDGRAARAEFVQAESGTKEWTEVARGHDARAGDYVLYRADVDGKECVGVRLVDHEPPGVRAAIANICDGDENLDAAFLQGRGFSLAYGRANQHAASISLKDRRGSHAAVVRTAPGQDAKYFAAGGEGHKVTVEAKDSNGNVVGTRSAGDEYHRSGRPARVGLPGPTCHNSARLIDY